MARKRLLEAAAQQWATRRSDGETDGEKKYARERDIAITLGVSRRALADARTEIEHEIAFAANVGIERVHEQDAWKRLFGFEDNVLVVKKNGARAVGERINYSTAVMDAAVESALSFDAARNLGICTVKFVRRPQNNTVMVCRKLVDGDEIVVHVGARRQRTIGDVFEAVWVDGSHWEDQL